jgi:hypothetical protein
MYWFDTDKHKLPHFHAKYGDHKSVFDLDGNPLTGNLGTRANRLVKEWCDVRKEEIYESWDKAIQGKEVPWVKPIR